VSTTIRAPDFVRLLQRITRYASVAFLIGGPAGGTLGPASYWDRLLIQGFRRGTPGRRSGNFQGGARGIWLPGVGVEAAWRSARMAAW